jgi:hypothetical protein
MVIQVLSNVRSVNGQYGNSDGHSENKRLVEFCNTEREIQFNEWLSWQVVGLQLCEATTNGRRRNIIK